MGQAKLYKTDGTCTALREWTMHQLISSNNLSVTWMINNVTVMPWGKKEQNGTTAFIIPVSSQDIALWAIDVLNLRLETTVKNCKILSLTKLFQFLISTTEKKKDLFPWSLFKTRILISFVKHIGWSVFFNQLTRHYLNLFVRPKNKINSCLSFSVEMRTAK